MTQSNLFFFKAFESNYNSLSLIKLVPPHHSVMFFLATPQLEELLVFVSPQRDTPFCLIAAGQTDHQHQCCCSETKWCGEKLGKRGWGSYPSTQEPWLRSSALVWRERKKSLHYRNVPFCHWSWKLLLLLGASEDNFILLLEFLQLYCIGLLSCHAVLWVPVCWTCCWQCQTDRKVNAQRWANLVLATCTCTHKGATLLLSPRMTDCSYKNH